MSPHLRPADVRELLALLTRMEAWLASPSAEGGAPPSEVRVWVAQLRMAIPPELRTAEATSETPSSAVLQLPPWMRLEAAAAETASEIVSLRESPDARARDEKLRSLLRQITQQQAEAWAMRLARRSVIWRLRQSGGGRFLLYWLTWITGLLLVLAWTGALLAVGSLVLRLTDSLVIELVTLFLLLTLLYAAANMQGEDGWISRATYRFIFWLRQLENR